MTMRGTKKDGNKEPRHVLFDNGFEFMESSEYEKAILEFDKIIASAPPNSGDCLAMAEAYYQRGVALYELGKTEMALADFNTAIEIDEKHWRAYGIRGRAFSKTGKYEWAINDYEEQMRLMGPSDFDFEDLGDDYAVAFLRDFEETIRGYRMAIEATADAAQPRPTNTSTNTNKALQTVVEAFRRAKRLIRSVNSWLWQKRQ